MNAGPTTPRERGVGNGAADVGASSLKTEKTGRSHSSIRPTSAHRMMVTRAFVHVVSTFDDFLGSRFGVERRESAHASKPRGFEANHDARALRDTAASRRGNTNPLRKRTPHLGGEMSGVRRVSLEFASDWCVSRDGQLSFGKAVSKPSTFGWTMVATPLNTKGRRTKSRT